MDNDISKTLCANTIEQMVITYIATLNMDELASKLNSEAMDLISEIKAILDDDTAGDPECFRRIDAIVSAFWAKGIYTPRHDW